MYDVYFWTTPNGYKVTIFMEEAGLDYTLKPVNISVGEQFDPAFLEISPNNRMPAMVDHAPADGSAPVSLFESGAILLYLADKIGQFIPADVHGRADVLQWLFWQMGGLGPMAGQNHHFAHYAPEKIPYAIDRYVTECARLYAVMDKRLSDRDFLAGDYSIADMAAFPWVRMHKRQGQDLDDFPNLKRWRDRIRERDAVVRAYEKGKALNTQETVTEDAKKVLFGQTADTVKR